MSKFCFDYRYLGILQFAFGSYHLHFSYLCQQMTMSCQQPPCSRAPTQVCWFRFVKLSLKLTLPIIWHEHLGPFHSSKIHMKRALGSTPLMLCFICISDYTYAGQTSSKRQGILAFFDFISSQFQNILPSRPAKDF